MYGAPGCLQFGGQGRDVGAAPALEKFEQPQDAGEPTRLPIPPLGVGSSRSCCFLATFEVTAAHLRLTLSV